MPQIWPNAPIDSNVMIVQHDWVDYNGHLNMAYYNTLFDLGCDEVLTRCGLGEPYVKERNGSYFTAEAHVCYLRELSAGMPVIARLQVLDLDAKRLHVFQELVHAEENWLSATSEQMCLHVDLAERKTAPWPDDIMSELSAVRDAHSALEKPAQAGRNIGIRPTRS